MRPHTGLDPSQRDPPGTPAVLSCMHRDEVKAPRVPPRESVHELFPKLYRELRRLARAKLASGGRHTLLDTSALVHESFLDACARPAG